MWRDAADSWNGMSRLSSDHCNAMPNGIFACQRISHMPLVPPEPISAGTMSSAIAAASAALLRPWWAAAAACCEVDKPVHSSSTPKHTGCSRSLYSGKVAIKRWLHACAFCCQAAASCCADSSPACSTSGQKNHHRATTLTIGTSAVCLCMQDDLGNIMQQRWPSLHDCAGHTSVASSTVKKFYAIRHRQDDSRNPS